MRLLLALSALACGTSALANSVFIENHSFEEQVLGNGQFFYSPTQITGWTSTATGGADRGVWNTTAPGKHLTNIAFAYANNAVAQQLTETLGADRVYTLQYLMGRTGLETFGTAQLWAGGTVADGVVTGGTLLQSQTVSLNTSNMDEYSITYTSPSAGAPVGELLTVRFAGTTTTGSYVSFDNFRLSWEPVPEPATLAALGLGVAVLARRRRKA